MRREDQMLQAGFDKIKPYVSRQLDRPLSRVASHAAEEFRR